MKVGIIGCGNIAEIIAENSDKAGIEITALYDLNFDKALKLARFTGGKAHSSFDDFLKDDFEVVVEAASIEAVKSYAEKVLESGRDLIILSVGALLDEKFREKLVSKAREVKRKVYVPSGAIVGVDGLKVFQLLNSKNVRITTVKNPRSLGVNVKERSTLIKGKAKEVLERFPKNVNVAATISLATGFEVEAEVVVDPSEDRNVHEIVAKGEFGEFRIIVRNVPSKNPRTSYLAALSTLALLKNLSEPLVIGT